VQHSVALEQFDTDVEANASIPTSNTHNVNNTKKESTARYSCIGYLQSMAQLPEDVTQRLSQRCKPSTMRTCRSNMKRLCQLVFGLDATDLGLCGRIEHRHLRMFVDEPRRVTDALQHERNAHDLLGYLLVVLRESHQGFARLAAHYAMMKALRQSVPHVPQVALLKCGEPWGASAPAVPQ